jgi:antitoxin CcdA
MNERVTVELDAETLKQAREAGVDLSVALRRGLRGMLPTPLPTDEERKRAAQQWYEENKEAVDASNELMEKHGLFSDGARMF